VKNEKSVCVTFPHNHHCGERAKNDFMKLINTALELGGTVYEVAQDAGLFSAYQFMQNLLDDSIIPEPMAREDMTIVTEVYVRYPQMDVLERVFLASGNAVLDKRLLETGRLEAGKLVIDYDKLSSLHEKGYTCYYQRTDATTGLAFNRFVDVFGKDQKMIPFKMWDSDCTFVGSGFNQALLVRTIFETVLVMPDIYAVEQCVKAVYAEKLIQERYEPTFCVERTESDGYVNGELELVRFQLFGRRNIKEYPEFRNSYRNLTQQVAYIKVHYLMVYDIVWDEKFEMEDERTQINWDEHEEVTLGVGFSEYNGSYAVLRNEKGRAIRVPNFDCPFEMPLHKKYRFKDCGDMRNAGVAASRLALTLKNIKQSAELMFDVLVKKVYITYMSEGGYPNSAETTGFVNARRKMLEKKGIREDEDVALIAYKEGPFGVCTSGADVIKWAAELAELPQTEYVGAVNATVRAFEDFARKNCLYDDWFWLKEKEIGLIYEMSEECVELTLFERKGDDSFFEIDSQCKEGPARDMYYDEEEMDREEYNPNLDWIIGDSLTNFMMDAGLRALGIYGERENDENAFEELRSSASNVRQQLRRCDSAKVVFDNGYLKITEEFPIERFENCYQPLLERNMKFLERFLEDNGYKMDDIKIIYAVGSEWTYPFVRKRMEEIAPLKTSYLAPFECVAARGAAFMD